MEKEKINNRTINKYLPAFIFIAFALAIAILKTYAITQIHQYNIQLNLWVALPLFGLSLVGYVIVLVAHKLDFLETVRICLSFSIITGIIGSIICLLITITWLQDYVYAFSLIFYIVALFNVQINKPSKKGEE